MNAEERRRRADEAFEAYLLARAEGSAGTPAELLEAHPELADLLEPMLEAHQHARALLADAYEGLHADRGAAAHESHGTGTDGSSALDTHTEWHGDLHGRIELASVLAPGGRSLESALVARVLRQVEAHGVRPDPKRVRHAVRSVLTRIFLSDEEKSALRYELEHGDRDAFGCVFGVRAREALMAGLRAADPHGIARGRQPVPRVVFLSADAAPSAHLERLSRSGHGEAGGDTLVLTERGPVQDLLRRLADQRGLALRLRARLGVGPGGEEHAGHSGEPPTGGELELVQVRRGLDFLEQEVLEVVADDATERERRQRPDPLVGQLFDLKYRIQRRIGEGGFGTVYEAIDETGLGNRVAIKVLRPRMGGSMRSFRAEARRVVRLSHANIVDWKVFDVTGGGVGYFVMELLEGEELDEVLQREGRLAPDRAARILLQILGALRAAHELGPNESILHLDLKPKNVFVLPAQGGDGERVKVFDFGIGQYIGGREESELELVTPDTPEPGELVALESVRFGAATGAEPWRCRACTPEYASPEQAAHVLEGYQALPLDGRSDVYSLGIMGFQMLTGQLPFPRPPKRRDALLLHLNVPARTVRSTGVPVPHRLAHFVDRCLVTDRDQRWSAAEAHAYLERIVHPPAWRAALKAAAMLILLFLPIGYFLARSARGGAAEFRLLAGGQVLSEPLPFGPSLREQRLTLPAADQPLAPAGGELEVVSTADGSPVPDWRARWDGGELVLALAPGAAPTEPEREVSVEAVGQDARSTPITLAYLDPERSRIGAVTVADGPVENQLLPVFTDGNELRLDCALEQVRTELRGEGACWPPHEGPLRQGEGWQFVWHLDKLGLGAGRHHFEVELEDQAGNLHERSFDLVLETGALAASAELRDSQGNFLGRPARLTTKTSPALVFEGTEEREVDLTWAVEDDAGQRIADGNARGVELRHRVALDPELFVQHREEPYTGLIRYTVRDDTHVTYEKPPLPITGLIDFEFTPYTAEFGAALASAGPGPGEEFRCSLSEAGACVPTGSYLLQVTRTGARAMPFQVVARCQRSGDEDEQVRRSERLLDRQLNSTGDDLALDLAEPGRYTIVVAAFAPDTPAPDSERRFEVLADGAAELVLEAAGPLAEPVREALQAWPAFRLARPTQARLADRAPIEQLTCTLIHDGVPLGPAAQLAGTVEDRALRFELPWSPAGDGEYTLEVRGRSRAGVEAMASRTWTVAADRPEIALAEVFEGDVWSPSTTGQREWRVEIPLRDPNGIDADGVSCAIRTVDDGPPRALDRLDLGLVELQPGDPGEYRLMLGHRFDYRWSEREVELVVSAADAYGNPAEDRARVRLDTIRPDFPSVLRVTRDDGTPLGPMRFVQVRNETYTLGGRSEAQESESLEGAGLDYEYGDGVSWVLDVSLDQGMSFYLDEREVSVDEFLGFLEGGYLDPAHWEGSGERPDEARRAELLRRLAGEDGGLPATCARWAEARAYAHWAGKRLPSVLEWEYAVRGGTQYRVCSVGSGARPIEAAYSLRTRSAPVPVEAGPDVTPDTGIRNLCSNVAEWTGSPVLAVTSGDMPLPAAVRHLTEPWAEPGEQGRSESFWRVGGDYQRPEYVDFSLHIATPRDAETGFRCALSAEDALERLATSGPVRFADAR